MIEIDKNQLTALILAGGKSSRMKGIDNGLMQINNKYVIQHLYSLAQNFCAHVLINANKNNNAGQIPVSNQNSNTVNVTNRLNQAYGGNNNGGTMNPPLNVMPPPAQFGNNNSPEGFSLF